MGFKIWLEDAMNYKDAQSLVLNAIGGVDSHDHEVINDIVSMPLKGYPNLAKELIGTGKLQSHASEITGWFNEKKTGPASVREFIKYIATLDTPNDDDSINPMPNKKPQPQQQPAPPPPQPQQQDMGGGGPPPQQPQPMQMAHRIWMENETPPKSLPNEGQVEYMGFLLSKCRGTNVGYGGITHKVDSRGKIVGGPFDASKHHLRQSTRKESGVSVVSMEDQYERFMPTLKAAIKFIHQWHGLE